MIENHDITTRTSVKVQNQLLPLPEWMVKETSQAVIKRGIALFNCYRGITNFHVVNGNIVAYVKGSKGNKYLVKVSIWNKDNGETPKLISCNCPYGVLGGKGFCYHRIAMVLKILALPAMPSSRPIPKYEDDFNLD